ncbi:hypothetical protein HRG_002145 [Hirsutella rhossiliensis]|uniref:Uncharacterized protein n=1 Tax=Hirsutella rhossiliensis TaxID=111463 RepID=A0A9P8SL96_9HYPO|nr:uncharacterized protein HRG_02145 [Hirsutella rhossiliensis]KAH0966736.1 hypothetical protein HRG_02145 [Hirsutella rhossiliensis]
MVALCDGGPGQAVIGGFDHTNRTIGLMYACFVVDVRGPGRGHGDPVRGAAVVAPPQTSRPNLGVRYETTWKWSQNLLEPGAGVRVNHTEAHKFAVEPWGAGRSGTTDAWSGRSVCDQFGAVSVVYVCGFSGLTELVHSCKGRRGRIRQFDMFGNVIGNSGLVMSCHAAGIRVPRQKFDPDGLDRWTGHARLYPPDDSSLHTDLGHKFMEPARMSLTAGAANPASGVNDEETITKTCVGGRWVPVNASADATVRRINLKLRRQLGLNSESLTRLDANVSSWENNCARRGVPYVIVACAVGPRLSYWTVCSNAGESTYWNHVGMPGVAATEGGGVLYNCRPVRVIAPKHGWGGKAGPTKLPGWHWISATGSRPLVFPGAHYVRSKAGEAERPPDAKVVQAVVAQPWPVGQGTARDRWDSASYCERAGLPSLVYRCAFDGIYEPIFFCRDKLRGWWYDGFGNQLASDGYIHYCHAAGIRVPARRYKPDTVGGAWLATRKPGVWRDLGHHPTEDNAHGFDSSDSNPWLARRPKFANCTGAPTSREAKKGVHVRQGPPPGTQGPRQPASRRSQADP